MWIEADRLTSPFTHMLVVLCAGAEADVYVRSTKSCANWTPRHVNVYMKHASEPDVIINGHGAAMPAEPWPRQAAGASDGSTLSSRRRSSGFVQMAVHNLHHQLDAFHCKAASTKATSAIAYRRAVVVH